MVIDILVALAVIYVFLLAIVYFAQTRLIFPAGRTLFASPADYGWEYEDVEASVDGHITHGWWVPAENARGVMLFSHGNGGALSHRLEVVGFWREQGMSVLVYDYGGYGRSAGRPSEARCYADGRAMWRYLTETKRIAPEQIILYGRSLGGGVAIQLAREVDCAGLIVESSFRSVAAMARRSYPIFPVKALLRHHFDNEAKIADIHLPVLIAHSLDDSVVPFAHGQALYELANDPKTFVRLAGDHNDGVTQFSRAARRAFETFLDSTLPESSANQAQPASRTPDIVP